MRTIEEIRQEANKAIAEKLSPAEIVRYHQQFSSGFGDYSKERKKILRNIESLSMDDFLAELKNTKP